jgi:ATP-dependent RNA helicase RhlE
VHLIQSHAWYQVLVFTRTKHGANKLAEQLERAGITALAIHGNKSQGARTRALAEFKAGKLQVLVATDIAARGIDIEELPHVVNYDLPNVPEDYVHRIGRTGRAGAGGEAISLVCVDERDFLRDIEKLIGRQLPRETVAGFEPDLAARPEPIPGVTGPRRPGAGRQGNPGGGRPRNGGAGRQSHAGDGRESANGGGWRKAGSAASQASPRGTSQGTARRAEPARRPQGQSPGNAGRRGR